MGGDCLNVGCVPSKSLIAAAAAAHAQRAGGPFGIAPVTPQVDFAAVRQHVHGVIAAIAPHDSVERFEALGVDGDPRAGPVHLTGHGRRRRAAHPGASLRRRHRQPAVSAGRARTRPTCRI